MLNQPLAGEAFNFSYELSLTVLEVVERISKIMGIHHPAVVKNQATREIPIQRLDSKKAREQLGWVPELGFDKAIADTAAWYRLALEKKWINW
jgi:CDP-glucose 4,6-dehydratase